MNNKIDNGSIVSFVIISSINNLTLVIVEFKIKE